MNSRIFGEREYVAFFNICLGAIVVIGIAYDRLPQGSTYRKDLFISAIVIGVVSFVAFVSRQMKLVRIKKEKERSSGMNDVVDAPSDISSPSKSKDILRYSDEMPMLSQPVGSPDVGGGAGGSGHIEPEYVRVIEAMEAMEQRGAEDLAQIFTQRATVAGIIIQARIQRSRTNQKARMPHRGMTREEVLTA
ncbi:hypothetical protein [Burkholderia gladioli]|uniref:hypothetical protein n=1 Tax=Burkholderia gladioli TaxID=28095 RepID=UPI001CC6B5BA|nr:hypothetical protein [Burkholderia gladioli]